MQVRILTEGDVYKLLPMAECIDVMAEAFKTLAKGDGVNPLRSLLRFPDSNGILGLMPSYLESPKSTGIKVVTVMPGNHGTPYDSHQGFVLVFEVEHGCPIAMVEASSITAIRTAAATGVATKLLARKETPTLAILGSGVQARTHLEAMSNVRELAEVRVWSRSAANVHKFVENESKKYGFPIKACAAAKEAVTQAGLICACTSAREPVLFGEWLAPGTHINAVGNCFPTAREIDTETVLRSRLFTDRRESLFNEAGDFLFPKKEGAVTDDHLLGEIGDLLLGKIAGRQADEEITLFKSLGIAVEDLAAAHYIYDKAEKNGIGSVVNLTRLPS